jgi:hypothetical protein
MTCLAVLEGQYLSALGTLSRISTDTPTDAETARVNWITNFSVHVDPAHRQEWAELMSPKAIGLIMRSLKADFKFVRPHHHCETQTSHAHTDTEGHSCT